MISFLTEFNYKYDLLINFLTHIVIFIGAFYVALQNRNLKQWHVTPLWYVGLASMFVVISIVCHWSIGPEFPLSYWNLGRLAETLSNISVASVALIMLIGTVRSDLKQRRLRNHLPD